jgi:hypothetical protein
MPIFFVAAIEKFSLGLRYECWRTAINVGRVEGLLLAQNNNRKRDNRNNPAAKSEMGRKVQGVCHTYGACVIYTSPHPALADGANF